MKDRISQIRQVHAGFIHAVVAAAQRPELRAELEKTLKIAESNGWTDVVAAARSIVSGRRDSGLLARLDEEDLAIVTGILEGLQNPATLPDPKAQADAGQAAPGLAYMIHLAGRGRVEALEALAGMGDQMVEAGGDMAQLGARLRDLINGQRDADRLCEGMGEKGRALMGSILEELTKLESH